MPTRVDMWGHKERGEDSSTSCMFADLVTFVDSVVLSGQLGSDMFFRTVGEATPGSLRAHQNI